MKSNPREVATKIVAEISDSDVIEKLDVAGPGFVNIFVKKSFVETQVKFSASLLAAKLPDSVVFEQANPCPSRI